METNKAGVIIADTSGLVSLFSPDDRNHAEAINAAKRLQHEKGIRLTRDSWKTAIVT
jgi:hypothetical protein